MVDGSCLFTPLTKEDIPILESSDSLLDFYKGKKTNLLTSFDHYTIMKYNINVEMLLIVEDINLNKLDETKSAC